MVECPPPRYSPVIPKVHCSREGFVFQVSFYFIVEPSSHYTPRYNCFPTAVWEVFIILFCFLFALLAERCLRSQKTFLRCQLPFFFFPVFTLFCIFCCKKKFICLRSKTGGCHGLFNATNSVLSFYPVSHFRCGLTRHQHTQCFRAEESDEEFFEKKKKNPKKKK